MFWRKKKSFTEETKPIVEKTLQWANEKLDEIGPVLSPENKNNAIRSVIDKTVLFKLEILFIYADIIVRAASGGPMSKFAWRRLLMESYVDSMVAEGAIRKNDEKIVKETAVAIGHRRAPEFLEHAKKIWSMNDNEIQQFDSLPQESAAGLFKLMLFLTRCAEIVAKEYVIDTEVDNVSGLIFEDAFQFAQAAWRQS